MEGHLRLRIEIIFNLHWIKATLNKGLIPRSPDWNKMRVTLPFLTAQSTGTGESIEGVSVDG